MASAFQALAVMAPELGPDEIPKYQSAKVSVRNAFVKYGSATILSDVNLDVRPQEIMCLIGASGCGKTTLLHLIAGLVPAYQGSVLVDGVAISAPGPDRVVVFQDDAVFPWLTVEKNVAYGLKLKRLPGQQIQQRVEEMVRLTGLTGSEKLYPRQLSGGMRKRVDLGRALAVEPEVLLMDEPYAALDTMTKERLQLEFLRIRDRTTMTVLFVTHDLEEAIFLGDRVAVMASNPGRVHSILDIPFDRPRNLDIKLTAEFQAWRGYLAKELLDAAGTISER